MISLRRLAFTTASFAMAGAGLATAAMAQDYSLWLYSGDSTTVDGYLLTEEAVYANCDEDCLDLDLFLYDAVTGELVAQDTAEDAVPYVVAPWDGDFVVEVSMPDCSHPDGCAVWVSSDHGF